MLKAKRCIDGERRRFRSSDPETALGLQLRSVVERLDVDVLVVADLDGAPINSAVCDELGDEEAIALGQLAASLVKERPSARTVTTTRGFVHVDLVDAGARTWALAAFARHGVPDAIGVARAVAGAARILRDGVMIGSEAPLPLVERGWGSWD